MIAEVESDEWGKYGIKECYRVRPNIFLTEKLLSAKKCGIKGIKKFGNIFQNEFWILESNFASTLNWKVKAR